MSTAEGVGEDKRNSSLDQFYRYALLIYTLCLLPVFHAMLDRRKKAELKLQLSECDVRIMVN